MDIIDYFTELKQSGRTELREICNLALSLLAFLPTSVICETAFSRYNAAMRSDRTSLDELIPEAYLILQSSSVTFKTFDVDHVTHLLKYVIRTGDAKKQKPHLEAARADSRRIYSKDG